MLSTGECHSVKEFCEVAFARVGITVQWKGEAGSVDEIGVDAKDPNRVLRARSTPSLPPDGGRPAGRRRAPLAKKLLGWTPKVTFKALARSCAVDADLAELPRPGGPGEWGCRRRAAALCPRSRFAGGTGGGPRGGRAPREIAQEGQWASAVA